MLQCVASSFVLVFINAFSKGLESFYFTQNFNCVYYSYRRVSDNVCKRFRFHILLDQNLKEGLLNFARYSYMLFVFLANQSFEEKNDVTKFLRVLASVGK